LETRVETRDVLLVSALGKQSEKNARKKASRFQDFICS
jgi:hypothetical protein